MNKSTDGIEKIEFFVNSLRVFKVFGFYEVETKKWRRALQRLLQFLVIVFCGLTTAVWFGLESWWSFRTGNVNQAMISCLFTWAYLVFTHKIGVVLIAYKDLVTCISSLEDCAKVFKNKTKILQCARLYRILFGFGMNFAFVGVTFYVLLPILHTGTDDKHLPLRAEYLPVLETTPLYEILYFYQWSASLIVGVLAIGYDIMFCGIMAMCAALLESVNDVMKLISSQKVFNEDLSKTEELKEVIKTFKDILRCISLTEAIFSTSAFGHCSYNYAATTCILYQLSVTTWGDPLRISMLFGGFTAMYQLSIYCFFGQMIPTQVEKFRTNLYCTNWYEQDKQFKQIILLSLHNTEAEPYIVAGKFLQLSHDTFATMLKGAYTFYTFLQGFNEIN